MMLSPNNRGVYTDALTPPAGFELDRAIAATFSLDLTTLLSVPLQLVLQATEDRNELMRDPIALYEALQRATERVHVFTQHGRMLAPKREHLLYSLLEPMVTEVVAPRGGAFHPKLWVLRFLSKDEEQAQFRLMLASKNLTADRCWDVALTLDGVPGDRENANGKTIASFFDELPRLSVSPFEVPVSFHSLVDELRHVEWELPDGFEELQFHVLGLDEARWAPAPSRRLVVISPFVRPKALEMLAKTSEIPVAVISRSESLAELDGETPFRDAYVLHDAAETEDGEDESSRGDFGRFSRERFFLEDESADHAEVKGPQDLARYLQAQIGLGLFTEETDLEKLASKLAAFIGKWPWEDAGADNPLLTIALAYFATLGTITPELTRHESRLVRRWYGKALREFGTDDTGTRKRIREGIADSDAWKDAVTRGLGKG